MTKPRVLIIDDERSVCELLLAGLVRRGFRAAISTSGEEGFEAVLAEEFDVVVTDLNMPGMNGLELCERIVANRPDVPVVVITAFGSLDAAVAAIRVGAYDFITKPFELDMLKLTLDRAAKHRALREEVKRLRSAAGEGQEVAELLGASAAMRKVHDLVRRIAAADTTVLVTGESGTGKELLARVLHARSGRPGPFVPVACGATPEPQLAAELFGEVRGRETDGHAARGPLFQRAAGGTLFLDEIGDLPPALQARLARALQEPSPRAAGARGEERLAVRVVAATTRDLELAVEERRFREDLFYRIRVVRVDVPPLRSRGTDVLLLAQSFLRRFAEGTGRPVSGVSTAAAERLMSYAWPGNVRELMNCIERAVALARYDVLAVEDLPEKVRSYSQSHVVVAGHDPSELVSLEELERRYIERVLEATGGHKTLAARILGLDRATLYRKLQRYRAAAGG